MNRLLSTVAASLVLMAMVAPALADGRHDDPWRRHHPPPPYGPPGAWMWGAPPPPVYVPGRRVVYMEPPLWATPTSPLYMDGFGRTCRDFRAPTYPGFGTACLMPDGQWRVVR